MKLFWLLLSIPCCTSLSQIADKDEYGYIVNISSLRDSPAGTFHNTDLVSTIMKTYGIQYVHEIHKSFLHVQGCSCGDRGTSIETNVTLSLSPTTVTTSSPLDSYLSVSFRRTFLKLEKVPSYRMRTYHPKSGFNSISFTNESAALLGPRDEHFITRYGLTNTVKHEEKHLYEKEEIKKKAIKINSDNNHLRHSKKDSSAVRDPGPISDADSDNTLSHTNQHPSTSTSASSSSSTSSSSSSSSSVTQLLYLVDRSAPLSVQRALVQGVGWWDEAFQYVRDTSCNVSE